MHSTKVTTLTSESIEQFRSSLCDRGRSTLTAKFYATDLRMFLKDLGAPSVPQETFEQRAMQWLTSTRGTLSPKTTCRRLTSLRSFAKWAGWGNVLGDYSPPIPAKGQAHPLPEGLDGIERLLAVASNEKQRALLALCGYIGLRVAEALEVRPSHFNLTEMTLTVRGKGDKTRILPVSTKAWEVLARSVVMHAPADDRLVHLKDRFARRTITDLGVRAGLKRPISSHDLRSTFGTEVYDKTKDLRVTQELMGHASSQTTELYTQVTIGKMRTAVEI